MFERQGIKSDTLIVEGMKMENQSLNGLKLLAVLKCKKWSEIHSKPGPELPNFQLFKSW